MMKSLPVAGTLNALSLRHRSIEKRMEQWSSRIDAWKGVRRTARALYSGGHWSVVRQLLDSPVGNRLQAFIVSAGYGLISSEAELAPYAATFALGQPDSVALQIGKSGPVGNVKWWKHLCEWRPAGVTGVRSITAAIKKWPHRTHLLALSPSYLDAISEDLISARKHLTSPQNLIVISTGKKRHGNLNGNVIPAPASLQTLLGGALVSLNVRLAAEVIQNIPAKKLRLDNVRQFIADFGATAKPRKIPKRKPMSDQEVVRFIKAFANSGNARSYTKMLRELRDSGRACEMKRFRKLFRATLTK